jgi:23S rRNA pseudouridine1911/1915/1917 synthase
MEGTELEVRHEEAGERLDAWLAARVPELSRARAKALIEGGLVRVNGYKARKGRALEAGDRVVLDARPGPTDFHAAPDEALELPVRFECDRFVIIEKPAGAPSHPLREEELGTVANFLVARYPEMKHVGYRKREPGIVHRLDTNTSGLMLAARTRAAFETLRAALAAGAIEKHYLARCQGVLDAPVVIDAPIANDPRNRAKVRACTDPRDVARLGARSARTEVVASRPATGGSLVELVANHARRHQIRAHLASIGHPLLGDTLYGGPPHDPPGHHLLHASMIRVEDITVESHDWPYGDRRAP